MTNTIKNPSPLVETVLKLDGYLSEIVRLGAKIEEMELKSDFDYEQAQRLMNRFTECGEGVAEEIVKFSHELNQARAQAEEAAGLVSVKATALEQRQEQHRQKMEQFQALGDKVRDLNGSLSDLRGFDSESVSAEEQARIAGRLGDFEARLLPLIEEAKNLRQEAHASRMKILEQGADSLVQSLSSIGRRVETFRNAHLPEIH